ncbi:synaptogenesis protein syg-2-like [Macrobrachium rosenbergii]|uniref:synaptogenesis protein syg-2-like n=1 Tax=Macrobrachium rosenbergii TaxID=79674 RepID=UPI0034D797AF
MTGAVGEVSGSDNEISVVEVVSGFNASLPCTIRIPANDAPLLTLWYQEENETPIYSYDQRTGVSGTSWADPRVFGGRAHYLAHLSPPVMLIMRVNIRDARLYRCRIDFHNSNSRVTWVRLKVIVPPERVEITPQISPVRLGQRDDVVCTAIGGNPPPSVVWLQNGVTVDPNSTVGQSGSFNRLEIPASRGDLKAPFTCQASNNNLTPPVFAVYVRNVTCGPTRILLEVSDNPLIVGRAAQITCKAFDSNPPARVTWYHQGKLIQKLIINVTTRGSETVSILHLQPGRHHHMRQLLCRAENPILPLETLEDIVLKMACRVTFDVIEGCPPGIGCFSRVPCVEG